MKKQRFLMYVPLLCAAAGLAPGVAEARKNACGKEMTAVEMADRALDAVEIQNVMAMHQVLGAPGGNHDLELATLWAQKTPGATFAHNVGIVTGIEAIRRYYGTGKGNANDPKSEQSAAPQGMMAEGAGNIAFRTLTTPIVHVAGDGRTAKAYWYTPGYQANIQNGEGHSIWTYEKYAIDFVREDGAWKIWHFHVYNDWEVPMGRDLAQYALEQKKAGPGRAGPPPAMPGMSPEVAKAFKATAYGQPYSADKVADNLKGPRPPQAYCRFADTFSYADE